MNVIPCACSCVDDGKFATEHSALPTHQGRWSERSHVRARWVVLPMCWVRFVRAEADEVARHAPGAEGHDRYEIGAGIRDAPRREGAPHAEVLGARGSTTARGHWDERKAAVA